MIAYNLHLKEVLINKIDFDSEKIVEDHDYRFKDSIIKSYQLIYTALWKDFIEQFNEYVILKSNGLFSDEFINQNLLLSLNSRGIFLGVNDKSELIFDFAFNKTFTSVVEAEYRISEFKEMRLNLAKELKLNVKERQNAFESYSSTFSQVLEKVYTSELFSLYKSRLSELLKTPIKETDFELILKPINEKSTHFKLEIKFLDLTEPIYIESNATVAYSKLEIFKNHLSHIFIKNILSSINRIVKKQNLK